MGLICLEVTAQHRESYNPAQYGSWIENTLITCDTNISAFIELIFWKLHMFWKRFSKGFNLTPPALLCLVLGSRAMAPIGNKVLLNREIFRSYMHPYVPLSGPSYQAWGPASQTWGPASKDLRHRVFKVDPTSTSTQGKNGYFRHITTSGNVGNRHDIRPTRPDI